MITWTLTSGPAKSMPCSEENGAGKTTLMNILYGLYQPDEGEILVNGAPATIRSPARRTSAKESAMVHQHFMLIPPLTVVENVVLGLLSAKGVFLDPEGASKRIREISTQYGLAVDPSARVMHLSVGAEQRVEILKALYRNVRILILDEPHRRAHARGSQGTLSGVSFTGRVGLLNHFHHPQARRGDGACPPNDRHAARKAGRDDGHIVDHWIMSLPP